MTVPELHYATEVLKPVLKAWRRREAVLDRALAALEHTGRQRGRVIGMPASLEFEELAQALRGPFSALVARGRSTFGSVDVFIEKTPGNSVLTPHIREVFPDAYILHVIRDPRSVVRSLRSASYEEWAEGWAPRSVLVSALMWRAYVAGARRGRANGPRYLELKYEDARQSLATEMARVRSWLDVRGTSDVAPSEAGSDRHEVVSTRVALALGSDAVGEPEGFGDGSTTRARLTPFQVWLTECVATQLMQEYGYVGHFRTAGWLNHLLEVGVSRTFARLPAGRKEDLALNLRRLRLFTWMREHSRLGRKPAS